MIDEADWLLVDVGNSRIKWALARSGVFVRGQAFPWDQNSLAEILEAHWGKLGQPKDALIANVAGAELGDGLTQWIARRWGIVPRFARSQAHDFGVTNAYGAPEKLGVDRWLGLVAAHHLYPGNTCVVDCGTAITVDLLDADGKHLGGLIAPGINMMRQALARKSSALALADHHFDGVFAADTASALHSGAREAAAGLIERTFQAAAELLCGSPQLLLTGGDASHLAPVLKTPYVEVTDLVLEGLKIAAYDTP